MKKYIVGFSLGFVAGAIDVTPMLIQKLPIDACLSAFTMWTIVGVLITAVDFKMHPVLKGIVTAFLVLAPISIIIAAKEPIALIPISIMTLILGSSLGFVINKFIPKQ